MYEISQRDSFKKFISGFAIFLYEVLLSVNEQTDFKITCYFLSLKIIHDKLFLNAFYLQLKIIYCVISQRFLSFYVFVDIVDFRIVFFSPACQLCINIFRI